MLSSMFDIGLWNILFWIFIGIALGGLLSLLIGSTRTKTVDLLSAPGLTNLDGRLVTIWDERTEEADELEAIEGVGPKIEELFHERGIYRFAQIAAMSPADIEAVLKTGGHRFDIANPFTWPLQAHLLANGRIAEHFALREKLRAGRLPVSGIAGLNPEAAKHLLDEGVGSVQALAAADTDKLVAKLATTKDAASASVVNNWIAQARAVVTGEPARIAAFFGIPATALAARTAATYKERRQISGPLVEARGIVDEVVAAMTTRTVPSALPLWLGLLGAGLLALLPLLGLWRPAVRTAPVEASAAVPGISVLSAELGTDTTFETNSAVLTETGRAEVDSKIIDPARNLDLSSIRIVGHADVRGDDASNLKLSRDRAESVANYIRGKVKDEGIKWNPRVIEVYGAGEQFPNPNADTEHDCASLNPTTPEASACYAPDRRVDITTLVRGAATDVDAAAAISGADNKAP